MTSAPSPFPLELSLIVSSIGRTLGGVYRESYRAGTGVLPDPYQEGRRRTFIPVPTIRPLEDACRARSCGSGAPSPAPPGGPRGRTRLRAGAPPGGVPPRAAR